ncbi:ABC transporter ATP-binding protein [Candidatus Giovannonibacteria bacterium]|nr:ABC transporter ATP-binding protein [Candidatus Giovannonibacteria bacterium]
MNLLQFIRAWNLRDFFFNIYFILGLSWKFNKMTTLAWGSLNLIGSLVPVAQIYIGKLAIDQLVIAVQTQGKNGVDLLFFYIGAEIFLKFFSQAIASASRLLSQIAGELFTLSIGKKVLDKISTLDISYFETAEFHDKIERINNEATYRAVGVVNAVFGLLREIAALVALAAVFAKLGGIFLAIIVITTLPVLVLEFWEASANYDWKKSWGRSYRVAYYYKDVIASYENFQERKLFRLSSEFIARYWAFAAKYVKDHRKFVMRREGQNVLKNLLPDVGYYWGFFIAVRRTLLGSITLGDLTIIFMTGYRSALGSLMGIARSIGELYKSHLFIRDLIELLSYEPRLIMAFCPQVVEAGPLTITFERVSFRYSSDKPDVLTDVSFSVNAGERIALVGENGAGKTTLVKLLLRFYDPTEGRILINGIDLKEVELESYYSRIGGIFQDFVKYEGRVREQIAFGEVNRQNDHEKICHAAKVGRAEEFILKLPLTYETSLGDWEFEDKTEKLSGGQWQRLALSRACMNVSSALIVLDEPSSSLDAEAEEKFFGEYLSENSNKSIIFISHRFSTVRKADSIYLFQNGKIIESGSHDALMKLNGRYAELFNIQAKWYK